MVLEAPGAGGATGAADGAANNANAEGDRGNAGGNNPTRVDPPEAYLATFYTGQLPVEFYIPKSTGIAPTQAMYYREENMDETKKVKLSGHVNQDIMM